jgi:NAD(P)H-flavin reductase/hemoglobin-like flavoprotein
VSDLPQILRESWSRVAEHRGRVAEHFYARLFLDDPQLRDLFPVNLDVQRERLLGALVSAVQTFADPDRVEAYLRALGRDHRKYHVRPEHYGRVKTALIGAIRHYSGEHWTSVTEQAWNDMYDYIAGRMLAGAAADTDPPYWHAEVLAHERRGSDVAVFTCRPLRPLGFRAGQYVSIECAHRPRMWRTYSVANAPRPEGTLDFHIRDTGGWVSSALVRRLRPGDMLRLAAPMGAMTLDPHSRRDVVLVTGGTGLAPVKALLDELTRVNRTRWVHLFRGERRGDRFYDREHLDRIAERYPYLSIVRAASDDPDFPGERGPISDVVFRHGPWRDHDFYVAGSAAMVRATLGRLAEMRVPSARVRYDAFTGAD